MLWLLLKARSATEAPHGCFIFHAGRAAHSFPCWKRHTATSFSCRERRTAPLFSCWPCCPLILMLRAPHGYSLFMPRAPHGSFIFMPAVLPTHSHDRNAAQLFHFHVGAPERCTVHLFSCPALHWPLSFLYIVLWLSLVS